MITKPNSAAFACNDQFGLTKREYFAAQILASLAPRAWDEELTYARQAVAIADKLIEALNEERDIYDTP